uniref:Latent-transforming growth factor beta-binding protein 4 n=1 Tax=Vombatus ursinus TaxID=29139 RepID=A0A4X2M4R0_VOMUR
MAGARQPRRLVFLVLSLLPLLPGPVARPGPRERLRVLFTPAVCRLRCTGNRCVPHCVRANTTSVESGSPGGAAPAGPGFRVFLCPLLCHNGGVCVKKDRCLCPPDFAGKYCQLPASRTRHEAPPPPPPGVTKSVYTLPLANHREEEDGVASLVSVHVEHPQEASVIIHQVERVSGPGPSLGPEESEATGQGQARASGVPSDRAALYTVLAQSSPRGEEEEGGGYTDASGFGYCFRQLREGECASPLPGLRTQEVCCRGAGLAWGVHDCQPCSEHLSSVGRVGSSDAACPTGFERVNGSCADVDECAEPGRCQHGECANTRGGYTCVCPDGYLLDSSRSSCISQHVISEAKGPCFRVLRAGGCSLPILRNITKQICCCSRVGKAWGHSCQLCPPFGSEGFREICPAGPGYHYSASDLRYNTRPLGQEPPRVPISQPRIPPPATPAPPVWAPTVVWSYPPTSRPEPRPRPRPQPQPRPEEPLPTVPIQPIREFPERGPVAGGVCQRNPQICGPGRCIPRQGGYTCVCDSGFWLSTHGTHCIDVDECRQVPRPCTHGRCENSAGSYRCICAPGFQASPQGTECQDVDECVQQPCTNGRCENTPGSYLCVCPAGYKAAPHGAGCQDINECAQSPGPCGWGHCENLPGSYRCSCPPGFQGPECEDIDECARDPPPCGPGRCDNTAGSYHCACPAGYRSHGPGAPCVDVDECQRTPSPCSYGRCENVDGSYLCTCPTGFRLNAAGQACEDIDECENHVACPGQECVNSPGSFQCRACPVGHRLLQGHCADVDECSSGAPCGPHGHCTNTDGSFRCSCEPGYRLPPGGRSGPCADVNECLEGDFCFPHGECLNTDGSFACTCAPGYQAGPRGSSCIDVDECRDGSLCQGGLCTNTDGSFECACPPGYRASADLTSCSDVDECREGGSALCGTQRCENSPGSYRCVRDCDPGYHAGPEGNCDDVDECREYGPALCGAQRCENTPGSYRCVPFCDPGYQPTPSGGCQDVDECRNRTFCGAHATCQNLPGSFQCLCDQGYEGARDGRHCVDVNECETLQGVCGAALCENVEGSFLCVCPTSPDEFDPMTGRCVPPKPPARSSPQLPLSPGLPARLPPLPAPPRRPTAPRLGPGPGASSGRRECYYDTGAPDACDNILARNVTWRECCCTVGEGWGSGCRIQQCPGPETAEYQSLCPHGRGYLSPPGDPSIRRDVDECLLFGDQVCKSGVCVNTAPGYSCYCSNGYYYHTQRLECIDNDECSDEEEACEGGQCVNTVGSYHCTCDPPLVLDGSRRRCVTNDSQSLDDNLAVCWQEVGPDLVCSRPRLDRQATYTECCCLYGEAWSMDCALCPARDSDDFEALCNVLRPPAYGPARPGGFGIPYEYGPDFGPGYGGLPYGPELYPPPPPPVPGLGYDPYPPPPGALPFPGPGSPYGPPPFEVPDFDSVAAGAYGDSGGRPPLDSTARWRYRPRDTGGSFPEPEEEEEEEAGAPYAAARYEPFEGLQAEECGILDGCNNGRCIRVPEGYTCDCFDGYRLDMARMACVDINECEEAEDRTSLCVNGRCLNSDGSFRCVCRPGYMQSHQPHRCVPARPQA